MNVTNNLTCVKAAGLTFILLFSSMRTKHHSFLDSPLTIYLIKNKLTVLGSIIDAINSDIIDRKFIKWWLPLLPSET